MKGGKFVGLFILVCFVLASVYYIYLGGVSAISFNDIYVKNFSFVSSPELTEYKKIDLELNSFDDFLENSEVESYRYIWFFDDSEELVSSGVVLDRVMIEKVDFSVYSEDVLGGKDYYVVEFPYKNKFSFLVANLRINSILEKESYRRGIELKREFLVRDLLDEKLIYYFS